MELNWTLRMNASVIWYYLWQHATGSLTLVSTTIQTDSNNESERRLKIVYIPIRVKRIFYRDVGSEVSALTSLTDDREIELLGRQIANLAGMQLPCLHRFEKTINEKPMHRNYRYTVCTIYSPYNAIQVHYCHCNISQYVIIMHTASFDISLLHKKKLFYWHFYVTLIMTLSTIAA